MTIFRLNNACLLQDDFSELESVTRFVKTLSVDEENQLSLSSSASVIVPANALSTYSSKNYAAVELVHVNDYGNTFQFSLILQLLI